VASLVQEDGRFLPGYGEFMARYLSGGVRDEEVEAEWSAADRALRGAGVRMTHLDSIQHLHLVPGLFRVALRIARANGIMAMRFRACPRCCAAPRRAPCAASLEFLPLRLMEQSNLPYLNSSGIRTPDRFFGFHSTGHLDRRLCARAFRSASRNERAGLPSRPRRAGGFADRRVGLRVAAELEALTSSRAGRSSSRRDRADHVLGDGSAAGG